MKKKLVKRDLNNLGLDFGFGNFCFFSAGDDDFFF